MKTASISESELNEVVIYTCIAFLLMGIVLVLFFYFSRKKIIEKELEKKELEIRHQKKLLRAGIITQETERKRIAQDLHDDISSKLNIVSLNCHLLKTPSLPEHELEEIRTNIINLTVKALDSSRKIAHGLLPPVLEKFGLHAGIEELCLEFSSSKQVQVTYNNKVEFDTNNKDKHLHVFRILQELMNNSLRHGKASQISVLFEELNGRIHCLYTDNGIGFEMENSENQKGLGMKNIESRVAFIDGKLAVESAVNKGIKVNFSF